MKVLNFGSLNIDHVYQLDEFVQPGETVASHRYQQFFGGKGLNQSVALAKGGAHTYHAGQIGTQGRCLKDYLNSQNVNTKHIREGNTPTGHAIIQVNSRGENAIIVSGCANQAISTTHIESVISQFSAGDILLVQNETAHVGTIIELAKRQGLTIAFNPAPFTVPVHDYPLGSVDIFFLNETELLALAKEQDTAAAMAKVKAQFAGAAIISTRGAKGVSYGKNNDTISVAGHRVQPVDTTAAGDTFIGYFLASLCQNKSIEESLQRANSAAAVSVTRSGAADSIPTRAETLQFIQQNSKIHR